MQWALVHYWGRGKNGAVTKPTTTAGVEAGRVSEKMATVQKGWKNHPLQIQRVPRRASVT